MTKARTEAQKRRDRKARHDRLPDVAPIPKRKARGSERMTDIADEAAQRDLDVPALVARLRQSGIPMIVVPERPDNAEDDTRDKRKARHEARLARSAQLRDMRAQWRGCNAGRAMASVVTGERDRAEMWSAILHMRRVQLAYDRALQAPARHPECLRIMLPLDEMTADATTPPPDLRTDDERYTQAIAAWMRVQGWLGHADKGAAGLCKRVVVDDERCPDARLMVAALRCVADGLAGRRITYRTPL